MIHIYLVVVEGVELLSAEGVVDTRVVAVACVDVLVLLDRLDWLFCGLSAVFWWCPPKGKCLPLLLKLLLFCYPW